MQKHPNWNNGCRFVIWKERNGKILEPVRIKELLANKKSDLISGFVSKAGKKFDAYLVLGDDGNVGFEFPSQEDMSLGKCPVCGKDVIENKLAYSCSAWKEGCKFTIWKNYSHKTITTAQAKKLLKGEETAVINGFKDKEGNEYNAKLKIIDNKVEKIFDKS